jgi:hypothetical protein
MRSVPNPEFLGSQIRDIHLRIRVADIGEYLPALLGSPHSREQTKSERRIILPVLKSLVVSGYLDCCRVPRPFLSPAEIAVAEKPFITWTPGDPDIPISVFSPQFIAECLHKFREQRDDVASPAQLSSNRRAHGFFNRAIGLLMSHDCMVIGRKF